MVLLRLIELKWGGGKGRRDLCIGLGSPPQQRERTLMQGGGGTWLAI